MEAYIARRQSARDHFNRMLGNLTAEHATTPIHNPVVEDTQREFYRLLEPIYPPNRAPIVPPMARRFDLNGHLAQEPEN